MEMGIVKYVKKNFVFVNKFKLKKKRKFFQELRFTTEIKFGMLYAFVYS